MRAGIISSRDLRKPRWSGGQTDWSATYQLGSVGLEVFKKCQSDTARVLDLLESIQRRLREASVILQSDESRITNIGELINGSKASATAELGSARSSAIRSLPYLSWASELIRESYVNQAGTGAYSSQMCGDGDGI
jgi:hypothetical protein